MTNTNAPQKIIVASDGSIPARNAIDVALQIARAKSQLVEGFYVVDESLILDPYADYAKELGSDRGAASRTQQIEWFEELGSSILGQLQEKCAAQEVPVITKILLGGVPEIIIEKANQISFLALGRRGNTHADVTDHLGKNFRLIAHRVQVPLIVGGDIVSPLKRLFLVYDGSEKANSTFKLAHSLAKTLAANLTVGLTAQRDLEEDPDSPLFHFLNGKLDRENIVDLHSMPMPDVVDVIVEKQSDLIIMSSYRHPEIMEWLVGSPHDQILRQSSLPAVIA